MYFYCKKDIYRDIHEKLFWSTISACYSSAKFYAHNPDLGTFVPVIPNTKTHLKKLRLLLYK